ncbi:uncharacterized protein RAG0_10465 [Rhynchosporium agropyri]|uniref:Uncharacterized protein n=1 Tax=Rhynchosporium agropyri TaxID=914238 RepID=A0A1E1KZZ7_9HELO|nr:uncharacterized protein RAG0_10465 [Rhynchosporium agropyri]
MEYQYFDRFYSRTSVQIFPSFDFGLTRQILLQACETNAAIRHCVIAIGALDKTATTQHRGRVSFDSPDWTANASNHHRIAMKQYAKAVGIMNASASTSQFNLRDTLLTSILVLCFEAWNGNISLAVQQIHTCVKLILQWKSSRGSISNPGSSPQPNVVESELLLIFDCLAIQVTFFSSGDSAATSRGLHLLGSAGRICFGSLPDSFTDLKEAEIYGQEILRQGILFLMQHNSPEKYANASRNVISPEILAEQAIITTHALRWRHNFEKLKNNSAPKFVTRYTKALELFMASNYTATATCLSNDETVHDFYTDIYSQVVDLAGEILNELTNDFSSSDLQASKYSFDNRYILPVLMAGLGCRNLSLRKRAIDLLLMYPRREGIWDSECAAKMVLWISGLECNHSENGYIPGWARAAGLVWTTDLETRTADLRCCQRITPLSDPVEKQTTISW